MTSRQKRARRAAARAIGIECGGMSVRATLNHLDQLEKVGLIEPIDNYEGGVYMPDLGAVVKFW
ncbi:hypothetical protein GOEFS_046_00670 [Gordonia effusa NBRC 100432]|uniref:Transcriptional regulator n=1 Tax=Gordonia effusa NBRC 100432 TaxID=1077974 RepID=H0QZ60_9ACTN|nr:hypothetical protein [Gordonia effusa]GAB18111.1 hypothetical protein GOEFS_046_00670 [Gordonia effusa NBRC 100432]